MNMGIQAEFLRCNMHAQVECKIKATYVQLWREYPLGRADESYYPVGLFYDYPDTTRCRYRIGMSSNPKTAREEMRRSRKMNIHAMVY